MPPRQGLPIGDGADETGLDRSRQINAVERAQRRLGTDYIDLLHLHAFDTGTPILEVLRALEDLRASSAMSASRTLRAGNS